MDLTEILWRVKIGLKINHPITPAVLITLCLLGGGSILGGGGFRSQVASGTLDCVIAVLLCL